MLSGFCFVSEIGSHYVPQSGLEFQVFLLPQVLGLQRHGTMPAQPALSIFVYEISPDPRVIKRPYYHLVKVPKCNAAY